MARLLTTPIYILLVVVAGIISRVAGVLLPADDPFYTPPEGYQNAPAGTVFKNRSIEAAFLGLVPEAVEAHQLLYRTTAVDGTPIATVTTLFKPLIAFDDRFVSFQTAEDGVNSECAPSYNYQLFANQTNQIVSLELIVIQAYLAKGYIVSSPDYEGPQSAFPAGRLEGQGVLDSMRAVNNFADGIGLGSGNNAIVGVGYSGGAIATGWAAQLQPTYAKDLKIKGWVTGGPPANLTGTLLYLDGTTDAGFLPMALVGLMQPSAYGATLEPFMKDAVTPEGQAHLDYASEHCGADDLKNFENGSILSTSFSKYGEQLLSQPVMATVLGDNTMGMHANETPTAPYLLYHSEQDATIPYANASTLYDHWCSDGADVHFTTYTHGDHGGTEILGLPAALTFVGSAFAGTLAQEGCSTSTVDDSELSLTSLGLGLENIAAQLISVLAVLDGSGNDT